MEISDKTLEEWKNKIEEHIRHFKRKRWFDALAYLALGLIIGSILKHLIY